MSASCLNDNSFGMLSLNAGELVKIQSWDWGGKTRSHAPSFCMTACKDILLLFSMGEGWVALSMHNVPVLSSYVSDHAALLRISVNADSSTLLKC